MIEMREISKRFGAVVALEGVSLKIPDGRILGLLGENGAGKSTLMQILFGLVRADDGKIVVDGAEVKVTSPRVAQELGMGMVHQHFKLVPTLTALQNLALFTRESEGRSREKARQMLAEMRWEVPLDDPVGGLPVGQQQRIEIIKALLAMEVGVGGGAGKRAARGTLILDEPTAVLTPQETGELFAAMRELRARGVAIVFISHKLAEVESVCDEVAILRRGRLVYAGGGGARGGGGISREEIARRMIGAEAAEGGGLLVKRHAGAAGGPGRVLLELKDVRTQALKGVTLSLRAGEILGIAGVDGNGQTQLVQAILGTLPPPGLSGGEVRIDGKDARRIKAPERVGRIAFIAEDRQREALVLPLSVEDNLMLKDYRGRRFSTMGWLRFGAWRRQARELMAEFDIRASGPMETVGQLSGGNQQKVVLARELHGANKEIILAVNPTRGLDIGATAFVLRKLVEASERAERPAAVLLIHSDLDELLSIADRVAVMYGGRLIETRWPGGGVGREEIGRKMVGLDGAVEEHSAPGPIR